RAIWRVRAGRVARIDLRELVSVGAPAALEGKRVHVENHDAPAEGAVSGVELAGGFVQTNLFDLADDHRRARWILREKRGSRGSRRLLGRRVGATTPATPAAPR